MIALLYDMPILWFVVILAVGLPIKWIIRRFRRRSNVFGINPIVYKIWKSQNKKPMTADEVNRVTINFMRRRAGPPVYPWPRRCTQVPLIKESDVHEFGSNHRIPPRCIIFPNRQNNDKKD